MIGFLLGHGRADSCKQNPGFAVPFLGWFTIGVTGSFFGIDLFNVLHHEMWRDELQAWMIARESGSIFDLVRNMRYEGHPPLWFLLLYAITRFTKWLPAMQLLNVAIATGAAYLVAAYSPFTKTQKVLLCFGYFPLYEYGTISRNYGLGMFFLFWFCAWYGPGLKKNWIVGALLLSGLANTSVYGTMIALAFAIAIFAFPVISAGATREFLVLPAVHVRPAAMIFCGGIALALAGMHPPPDTGFAIGWHLPSTAAGVEAMTGVWRAFLPIPNSLSHFWNTNFFVQGIGLRQRWLLLGSAIILLTALFLLARKRFALLAYTSATGAILTFMLVKYLGPERQLGHLFLVFIACLWISAQFPEEPLPFPRFERSSRLLAGQRQRILTCILCVHFATGATASLVDWARPFSQGKSVAGFLRSRGMTRMFMVGDIDFAVTTVAGYLDRGIYYPRSQSIGSFVVWNRNRLQPQRSLIEAATDIATRRKEEVLIISNGPLETGSAYQLAEFTGSIEPSEDFYLYLVRPGH